MSKKFEKPKMVPLPSHSIVPERDKDKTPILECQHLGIDFGGLRAVYDLNLAMGRTEIAGLDMTSLQADLSIMDILVDAGASLSQTDGDQGIICVQRAPLTAFVTDVSHCPDLFPIVSVLAAFCQGRSRIAGVDRLAHKESDRGQAILQMLSQMGVEASVEGNTMIIEGYPLAQRCLTGRLLKGGKYTSWHDHRMVMALKVAGLGADSRIEIDDEECVGKSFPDFMERFSMIVQ